MTASRRLSVGQGRTKAESRLLAAVYRVLMRTRTSYAWHWDDMEELRKAVEKYERRRA